MRIITDRVEAMTTDTYNDPYNEYPAHSHEVEGDHADTCQVCGAAIGLAPKTRWARLRAVLRWL